ncbi:MAG: pirin family protein [Dehalococcoidia bacterium]|nr:pirin family protein [Dehalococcoidia bacterium]
MPAANTDNIFSLPRIPRPDSVTTRYRSVMEVIDAPTKLEGEGFKVRRPFPSADMQTADPFLLLDHLGAVEYSPGEAKGAPWHPHRGFETVTYIMDGAFQHHDSTGGKGLIADGATQWMTAGAGILHEEMPTEQLIMQGGLFHGVQLWVNLPKKLKWTQPRYQDIASARVLLLASHDAGAVVRLIAGDLAGHKGPGVTWTPISYAHASISPRARLETPWPKDFNSMVYVLAGHGAVGPERRPVREGQLAVFGAGDAVWVEADMRQESRSPSLEVLLLGGSPIREPVVFYGPFVMNTKDEIQQAVDDFRSGRLGLTPAVSIEA